MRFSKLFGKTLRQAPAEAENISHQLLLRAGMIAQEAAGIYSYLPSGWRVLRKIENIIREEMDKAGGQELMLPILQPFELWQQSGRYVSFGQTMFTLTDRKEHKLVLGPTHEEIIADLARRYVQSYRDLPLLVYQIQAKFRDEPRPRGGLLRVREFIMKDLYSFDADEAGLDESYRKMSQAYQNIYARCGLSTSMVEADSGAIGGKESHEFMVISETGEDEMVFCPHCGYSANVEKAQISKTVIATLNEVKEKQPLPLEEIATTEQKTIEEVANFLGVPQEQTLKAVFYIADGEFVFVVIRGDLEVNETKLKNTLKCNELRIAAESEVAEAGIVAGFASPIGIKGVKVVADDSITLGSNFIAGANKAGYHFRNVNYPRDFQADIIADIALAHQGDKCPECGGKLSSARGIEVGHIFKLGTFISEKLGASFLGQDGVSRPAVMGCYGIGLGRLLAAIVEQNHDDNGIIWPLSVAPYQVYLCPLHMDNPEVASAAEKVYQELENAGIEVLFDDRDESPGVKFNDVDLLGIPLRLTLSPRTLQSQSIEAKWRTKKETRLLPLENLVAEVNKRLRERLAR
ncbi:MAG: proline--tRNA ligase [Chloroflexi bacterium CG15_BIG_FIL_POST_REV_8_21_14_020_46_15]|nr:MAG: proline--tRNA ligase [Dehalococcoidia bacterium CG2_30_46_19]PIW40474.1 MAG: proline--tRNA ligase [Chloroflexi bacterium CG15_BIG_FIL_POST_REV_8_21_14_020_46_15]